jgi:hypothetical protein
VKKKDLVFAGAVAGILSLVGAAYVVTLGDSPGVEIEAPPPEPAAPKGPGGRLERADGAVEIRLNETTWQAAAVGTRVVAGSEVRTGAGGSASVVYGDAIRLDVQGSTEVKLAQLDDKVARFVVGKEGGLVVADIAPGNTRLVQVATEGSDAVAETRDGRLHVLTDGSGRMQTAVTRGQASVTANGETVALTEGLQSTVEPGQAPTAPVGIPTSLLLKVKWPEASTAKKRHVVSGTATPGARVSVGGKIVTADRKGRFQTVVELREGANAIKIFAIDVLGRKKEIESPAIVVDTHAPGHAVDTSPDMWKRKR